MAERNYEVRSIGIEYVCDNCNEGTMNATNQKMQLTDPPKFHHKCTNCQNEEYFLTKYPTIGYVRV